MPTPASEIQAEQTNLFLFVGAADSGKSYAATSFGFRGKDFGGTDPRQMYVLELDGRLNALRGRPVEFDSFTNIEGAVGVLNKLNDFREACIRKNASTNYHTLLLDSFTSFNDLAIADSLNVTDEKNRLNPKDQVGRKRGELSLMTTEDYGYEAEAVRKLLWEALIDIKKFCDVIVTAHETEYYRPVKVKPGEPTRNELAGFKILARDKISAKIPTKFDEIYHFLPKEVIQSMHSIRRRVVFQDMMARTSYPTLAKSTEEYDISGKEFYHFWKEKIAST